MSEGNAMPFAWLIPVRTMTREDLDGLIGTIYAAGTDPRGWAEVVRKITQRISGVGGALHVHSVTGTAFTFDADYNIDPAGIEEYVQHYHRFNPLIEPMSRLPVGSVAGDGVLVPREEIVKTGYYRDYGRRFGIGGSVTIVLGSDGPFLSCLGILHGWRADPFSDGKLALLRRLTRHFQRAIAINRQFETFRAEKDAMSGTLDLLEMGVVLLDGRGVILHANAAAVSLLRRRDGLHAAFGRLCTAGMSGREALDTAIHDALTGSGLRGGTVAIGRGDGRQPLSVRVAPLPEGHIHCQGESAARAIAFVTDPEAAGQNHLEDILAAYNLTVAERRVVAALASGCSVHEAAERLGISKTTARNHLNHAMVKTGTGRQAELLRLILSSRVPVL
jgi:DNA-binding CsgD family transcriptional regulator